MERDFLGIGSKNVTEEATDSKDSAPMKGSAIQWSFSNNVSAIPQFLSFNAGLEEKPRKSGHDALTSSGFAPISASDAFDSNQKPYSSMVQKSLNIDKQGASNYAMTSYGVQQLDAYQIHQTRQMRIFPVSNQQNQTITVSSSTSLLPSHVGSMYSQPLGRVPVISPVPVHPTLSSIVGTTDLRNGSKRSSSPAQLTIFYAGSVHVYDDVSSDKAQAIMLLAGHGSLVNHNKTVTASQVQPPIPQPSTGDSYVGHKTHTSSPCLALPSPISLASGSTDELATVKPVAALASASNQIEPPKAVTSISPGSATLFPSVAVPQARKASLARFLEKRKERVMSSSPYKVSKKSAESAGIGSDGMSLSFDSFSSPTQHHHLAIKGGL